MPHALTIDLFRSKAKGPVPVSDCPFLICAAPPSLSSLMGVHGSTLGLWPLRTLPLPLSNTIILKRLQGWFFFPFLPSQRRWQQPGALQVRAHLGHVPALRDRGAAVAVAPGQELAVSGEGICSITGCVKQLFPFFSEKKGRSQMDRHQGGSRTERSPLHCAGLVCMLVGAGALLGQHCPNTHADCH